MALVCRLKFKKEIVLDILGNNLDLEYLTSPQTFITRYAYLAPVWDLDTSVSKTKLTGHFNF